MHNNNLNRSSGQLDVIKCAMASKVITPKNTAIMIHGKLEKKRAVISTYSIIQPCLQSALPTGVSVTPALIDGSTNIQI
jgi:hypothetical protein